MSEPSERSRAVRAAARGDRGGASIWILVAGLMIVTAGLFGAAVGSAAIARHRAQAAADLAALAGAGRVTHGQRPACSWASEIARRNDARMVGCRLDGLDLVVHAEVVLAPWRGLTRRVVAVSRAGPLRAPAVWVSPDAAPRHAGSG